MNHLPLHWALCVVVAVLPLLSSLGCAGPTARQARATPYTLAPSQATASRDDSTCRPDAPKQLWAVVVGINDYQDEHIADLSGAVKDAWSFYHVMASPSGARVSPDRLMLLLNEEATRDRVVGALGNFIGRACPQDQVFIYFAGHGIIEPGRSESAFLLAHDTKMDNLVGTGISMRELPEFLQRRAGDVGSLLMLIDACHAGYVRFPGQRGASLEAGTRISLFNDALESSLPQHRNWGSISATASDQASFESAKGWRNCTFDGHVYEGGLFTCHLIRGLAGEADANHDGDIQLGELARHVNRRVVEASEGIQIPQLSGTLDPKRVLATVPKRAIPIPVIPEAYNTPEPDRPLRLWLWAGAGLSLASMAAGTFFYAQEDQVTEDINVGRRDVDYNDALVERDRWILAKSVSWSIAGAVGAVSLAGLAYELFAPEQGVDDVYQLPPLFHIDFAPTPNGGLGASWRTTWD